VQGFPSEQPEADRLFDQLVEAGAQNLTRKMVGLDKAKFQSVAKPLVDFATERIAHLFQEGNLDAELVRINDCLDLALTLYSKYVVLFFGPKAPPLNRAISSDVSDALDKLFAPFRP
jgi:hypothetical protein